MVIEFLELQSLFSIIISQVPDRGIHLVKVTMRVSPNAEPASYNTSQAEILFSHCDEEGVRICVANANLCESIISTLFCEEEDPVPSDGRVDDIGLDS